MIGRYVLLTAAVFLTGCAAGRGPEVVSVPHPGEIIDISLGPCFGFCPVYDVRVGAMG